MGKELDPADVANMTDEQKQRLRLLREEAERVFRTLDDEPAR